VKKHDLESLADEFLRVCREERRLSERTLRTHRCGLDCLLFFLEQHCIPLDTMCLGSHHVPTSYREWLAAGCAPIAAVPSRLSAARCGSEGIEGIHQMWRAVQCRSRSAARGRLATARLFCSWLASEEVLDTNWFSGVEDPVVQTGGAQQSLTVGEVKLLIGGLRRHPSTWRDFRDRALIEFLYRSGMHLAEIVALDWSSIDLTRLTVDVSGRYARRRRIAIPAALVQALEQYAEAGGMDTGGLGPVFQYRDGRRLSQSHGINIVRARARQFLGRSDVVPSWLRKSCGVHRLRSGASVGDLKKLLGLGSLEETRGFLGIDTRRAKPSSRRPPRPGHM